MTILDDEIGRKSTAVAILFPGEHIVMGPLGHGRVRGVVMSTRQTTYADVRTHLPNSPEEIAALYLTVNLAAGQFRFDVVWEKKAIIIVINKLTIQEEP